MTFAVQNETNLTFDFDYEKIAKDVVNAALDYVECPYETEVNLTITDNEGIREINRDFRDIDKETDVLSFPMVQYNIPGDFDFLEEDECIDCFNPESGELLLGDIIISVEKVKAQAKEFGHSDLREFAFLILHSMLHLVGYDHMEKDEAEVMEAKQREILDILDIRR